MRPDPLNSRIREESSQFGLMYPREVSYFSFGVELPESEMLK